MPEKIKILRVITRLNVGGPSCHVRLLMENLDSTEFEQRLIVGSLPNGETQDESAARFIHQNLPSLKRSLSFSSDIFARGALRRVIDDYQPDIIHSHQAKAGYLVSKIAKGRKPKIVHTYHGHTFSGYWGPIMGRLVASAERQAARRRDLIVAQSESQIEEIISVLGEQVRTKMRLIPPAIDFERLDPTQQNPSGIRSELGLTREKVLVFLGRLASIKNPSSFLRVFARIKELSAKPVVALMVGGGSIEEENRLHDLVDELGLRASVRWLGYRSDIASILSLADVCVSTSINEGTPLSLLEAIYSGVKVSAFDVGGIADILADKAGVRLVSARDEESLAQATHEQLVCGPLSRAEIAGNQVAVKQSFGVGRLAVDLQDLYRSLLR